MSSERRKRQPRPRNREWTPDDHWPRDEGAPQDPGWRDDRGGPQGGIGGEGRPQGGNPDWPQDRDGDWPQDGAGDWPQDGGRDWPPGDGPARGRTLRIVLSVAASAMVVLALGAYGIARLDHKTSINARQDSATAPCPQRASTGQGSTGQGSSSQQGAGCGTAAPAGAGAAAGSSAAPGSSVTPGKSRTSHSATPTPTPTASRHSHAPAPPPAPTPKPSPTKSSGAPGGTSSASAAAQVLSLINQARAQAGLPGLHDQLRAGHQFPQAHDGDGARLRPVPPVPGRGCTRRPPDGRRGALDVGGREHRRGRAGAGLLVGHREHGRGADPGHAQREAARRWPPAEHPELLVPPRWHLRVPGLPRHGLDDSGLLELAPGSASGPARRAARLGERPGSANRSVTPRLPGTMPATRAPADPPRLPAGQDVTVTTEAADAADAEPQAVLAPLSQAAIFLVVLVADDPQSTQVVRDLCGDVAALVRGVGTRDADARLTCVTGIGDRLWDTLAGGSRPAGLHPFKEMEASGRHAVSTPGDLLFHIRAARMDMCFELATRIMSRLAGAATVADEVQGFQYFDARDLIGFVDGTENPAGTAAALAALIGDEDAAFAGGSYVIVQKYVHDLAGWNALPTEEQERIIGREKLSDIELGDDVKPSSAHNALTTIEDADGEEIKIVRFNMPFGNPGHGEYGTYFIAYGRSPDPTEQMMANMFIGDPPGNYDRLLDFSFAVTGTLFFVPSQPLLESLADGPLDTALDVTDMPQAADISGSLAIGSLKGASPDE